MATQVRYPQFNYGRYPNEAWTNPGNAHAADDSYASASSSASYQYKNQIYKEFGFAIPTGSTLTSISFETKAYRVGTHATFPYLSCAVTNIPLPSKSFSTMIMSMTETPTVYSQTWTQVDNPGDLAEFFPIHYINSQNFAVQIMYGSGAEENPCSAYIDYVKVTIEYTPPDPLVPDPEDIVPGPGDLPLQTLTAAGDNDDLQLDVADWSDIVQTAAGGWHSVGLKRDGTAVATGANYYGATNVSGWTGLAGITAGRFSTLGWRTNGTCVSTGTGWADELIVTGWTDIVELATGRSFTVGRKLDGTCVFVGQTIEQGGYDYELAANWTGIAQLASSSEARHIVGLKSDGTVVARGYNDDGQCDVSSWSSIAKVSCGEVHTVGLKSDGTVVAVGQNYDGRCDVSSWTGIVDIACTGEGTIGVKSDGTCVAVGTDWAGELSLTSWAGIDKVVAGTFHTIGMTEEATPHEYEGGCLIPFSGSGVVSKRIITPRSVTGRLRLWSPDRLTLFMETTAFNSLQIVRRFVGNCTLEAYFPAFSEEAYYVIEGGWVEDDEGEWYRIHYRRATKDFVQLIAYGPHKVLGQRITVPSAGQYGISVTGSADSVIKGLVTQTIANAGRDLPILVASVRSGGTSISEISRYKNLGEEVERICYANDLGESFAISGTDFIFDTYAGTDRTRGNTAGNAPAIFSVRYDNLEDWAHAIASTDEVTTVYVAGQGSGTTRTMVIVGASTISEDRFEQFRDARDTNSAAILASRGAEAIFPPAESFSAKANTSSNLTYNTDYALGDLVTIEIPERTAIYNASTGLWEKVERYRSEDKRITEIVRTYEGGAMDIDLVFGEAPKTRGDKQSEVQSNLSRLEAI